MKLIVADTGPLNYLIQIRAMAALHGLVERLGQTSMFLSASLIRQALERDALRLSRTSHEGFPNPSPDTPPLPTDKNA